ncbi:hypothetical protein D9753_28605 [Streptomyces dangxiongensis]|uniref:Uncharacterized protein n=1 Tax=Streptomyces dangxiongensis TaxID=1442032 RepID=A0A3G2JNR1_9ACTN|nr:hypothetical protein D9753_28605 [Streptomyces dangxiongensis]
MKSLARDGDSEVGATAARSPPATAGAGTEGLSSDATDLTDVADISAGVVGGAGGGASGGVCSAPGGGAAASSMLLSMSTDLTARH